MYNNVIHTLKKGERVSSAYAEIYFDDEHCDHEIIRNKPPPSKLSKRRQTIISQFGFVDDWVSPSDLLIGIVNLTPPFTSKITRGITHEGILSIGNTVLANERAQFETELDNLLKDNEAAWIHILTHEKQQVARKVKNIFKKIYETKSKTMSQEVQDFYENNLRDLENHLRTEIQHVLVSAHANIVSDLNTEILKKLKSERTSLEKKLENRYKSEVEKIKKYYKFLFDNEVNRSNQLINRAIYERNDALNAFYKQFEAETVTSTMYVMSIERKKCRIKQFLLDNYQSTDIKEQLQKIRAKQEIIDDYKQKEHTVADINFEWESKIKRVVQLFLKFISYSLKLLPEQSTFLLDLEKMFVLQLNEIKKQPKASMHILVEDENLQNVFSFEQSEVSKPTCNEEPFVIVGDISPDIPPRYGSRETLLSNVDVPTIRLQRQYVYAKCHKYEEIKAFLESQRCKCMEYPLKDPSPESPSISVVPKPSKASMDTASTIEPMMVDDFPRVQFCPVKKCNDWLKRYTFPYLTSYLDFTEENYRRVKAILETPPKKNVIPYVIDPKDIAYRQLPFTATTETHHHVETQYSSQEDLINLDLPECPCADGPPVQQQDSHHYTKQSRDKFINDMLMRRKISLRTMLQANPRILKMLTDESFDFQL